MNEENQGDGPEPCPLCGALPCDWTARSGEMPRPEVIAFALLMERELGANDDKPGWKDDRPDDLAKRVEQEARELRQAVDHTQEIRWVPWDGIRQGGWFRQNPRTGEHEMGAGFQPVAEPALSKQLRKVGSEAADVANMAMMVADVAGCLASADTRPKDEDPAQTGASLASGAVPNEDSADARKPVA